jgi:L-arabinose isomerase
MQPGEATLINVTTGPDGRPQVITTKVEVLDFELPDYPTPHLKARPPMPLARFLNAYASLGGTHHLALSYGNAVPSVQKAARVLDIECHVI